MSQSPVRLNKFIADTGYCARRKADELILAGRVSVNGQRVDQLGVKVQPRTDEVCVDGQPISVQRHKLYLMMHKPTDCLTTKSDPQGRKTIYDYLPESYASVDPAGRLDRESSGVLILTNDGDFINRVTHPSQHVEKIYRVRTDRPVTMAHRRALMEGLLLKPENKLARMESIVPLDPNVYEVVLVTGYNRQIRRSLEMLGYEVKTLKRQCFGPVCLGRLSPGKSRELEPEEVKALLDASAPAPKSPPAQNRQKRSEDKNGQAQDHTQKKRKQNRPKQGQPKKGPSRTS